MFAKNKSTISGKLKVPFLNIHTGFDGGLLGSVCIPEKHGKFPTFVFMNKQIQKGSKCQQTRVIFSEV